ncbi:hypothetical protein HPP92_002201 [Vanilla planifolia]|uniref:CID domain-containing protein n=1 Tax=Vanilla planifolia TaxID=51239 RepID=A0A835RS44_VANPL|nr:hypothetical protein HPP92_002201 [Vanilla planifolia]
MDAERYRSSAAAARENPRSAGFSQERLNRLPMDPAQRPAPSIQERFRNMIRDREQELREAGEGGLEMPLLDEQDIVQIYEELLSELVFNSKPTITDLTIIAGNYIDALTQFFQPEGSFGSFILLVFDGNGRRFAVGRLAVPRDQKLPALYLLDSIVKNIGHEYVKYFAARLPKVFCEAYKEVHSSLHAAMRHLFGTWSRVFPVAVLGKIEDELKFASPENLRSDSLANMRGSESPHPSHGIHINPKYLVARQNRATDVQNPREVPFQMQATGEISSIKINERDSDHIDLQPSYTKFREGSPQSVALQRSAGGGQERPFLPSQSKVVMTSSPTRPGVGRSTSPLDQRLQRSSVRTNEVVGSHRASQRDVWFGRSRTTDDGVHQAAALTTYDGYGRQRQRELIDAYGNYRGKDTIHERFPKIPRVDANGIKSETAKWIGRILRKRSMFGRI